MARKNREPGETAELNLVPIMAIMVILVPMLIYMFTFHQIKVQRVTAPRRGTGAKKAKEEQKEKPLNLTVIILNKKEKGFKLTWDETLMTEQQSTPLIPMVQSKDEHCGDPDSENPTVRQAASHKRKDVSAMTSRLSTMTWSRKSRNSQHLKSLKNGST